MNSSLRLSFPVPIEGCSIIVHMHENSPCRSAPYTIMRMIVVGGNDSAAPI
jgi:hypothetical protein